MTKSAAWYYRWPGSFYAQGPMRFQQTVTQKQAREHLREIEKVDRLPRGMEFWETK